MAIFEDITLEWEGVPYTLAGDGQIMRTLAAVEEHVTITELAEASQGGKIPMAKLSGAYAAALRSAGARVTDAEVYAGMWRDTQSMQAVQDAVMSLMQMMMPPDVMRDIEAEPDEDPGTSKPKKKPSPGSKARTRRRSSAGD